MSVVPKRCANLPAAGPAASGRPPVSAAAAPGAAIVAGLLVMALGLGLFAVWFQRGQTRRCLEFFGPEAARRLQAANRVEVWRLEPRDGRVQVVDRIDASHAPGLVHLRRGLIEDFNYDWGDGGREGPLGQVRRPPLPADAWDQAVAFFGPSRAEGGSARPDDPAAGTEAAVTVVAFDLDGGGAATVVGRPGRVGLGRLRTGLATWLDDAWSNRSRSPAAGAAGP
jgi:hypothetical protein